MEHSLDMSNAPLGLLLSCVAGLCTSLGAAVVFFPAVQQTNSRAFAVAMGLSVGVMLYVSFVEILPESWVLLEEGGTLQGSSEGGATYATGTAAFFAGVLLYYVLDLLVHCLDRDHDIDHMEEMAHEMAAGSTPEGRQDSPRDVQGVTAEIAESSQPCTSTTGQSAPGEQVDALKPTHVVSVDMNVDCEQGVAQAGQTAVASATTRTLGLGFMTALAIAVHNFPEGLLCFIGTLEDPAVGGALAVAIGIHNIPEGICVAIPIYYATGSRCKAFAWATLAGLAEPAGALLAWAVLAENNSATANGVAFGLVGGMMVAICVKGMIPAALRYDPENKVTDKSVFLGMALMAVSLVLFKT